MKRIAIALVAFAVAASGLYAADADFVKSQGGHFVLGGKEFRFAGTNNYYLHYRDNKMIDDVFASTASMGLTVLRAWAFLDGGGAGSAGYAMQTAPGQLVLTGKSGFERLDYAISVAKKYGIRLVLGLVNNWNDFGGMQQYVTWLGLANHDDFYTNAKAKAAYKAYVAAVLDHTNVYTKTKYKDDPIIMTWELTNEARCDSDKSGNTIVAWAKEMSAYVKSLDPRHMVALGDEGFFNRQTTDASKLGYDGDGAWLYNGNNGVDWERITAIPTIDYGTFHMYAKDWGIAEGKRERWSLKFILDHAEAGKKLGKPVVLEEYGVRSTIDSENRDMAYRMWTDAAYDSGLAGTMFWLISGIDTESPDKDGLYPNYDGFRVARIPADKSTIDLIAQHAAMMKGGKDTRSSVVYFEAPGKAGAEVKGQITIRAKAFLVKGDTAKSAECTLPDGSVLPLSAGLEGDFSAAWDTKTVADAVGLPLGLKLVTASGATLTASTTVNVKNAAVALEATPYSFEKNAASWANEGLWQAQFGGPCVLSSDLGRPMLVVNVVWPGKADWEEVRIVNRNVSEVSKARKISFDVYIPASAGTVGQFRPYAVLNPGWIKLGLDANNIDIAKMEAVTLNGVALLKKTVTVEYDKVGPGIKELYISMVGNKIPWAGPVYLDNLVFYIAKE